MLTLEEILFATTLFAFKNENRYNINSVRFEYNAGQLKAIATDGHTLIIVKTKFKNVNRLPEGEYTMSLTDAKRFIAILKVNPSFQVDNFIKVQADFPNYERILPNNQNEVIKNILVNPEYMERICKIGKKFAKEGGVYFTFGGVNTPLEANIETDNFSIKMIIMPMKTI